MAQVIQGDQTFFKSAAYGTQDWKTLEFLSSQYNNLSAMATQTSSDFFTHAKTLYDKISGSTAMRMARQAAAIVRSAWDVDEIRSLISITEMQLALPTMQRWVMANPEVRNMYHKQQLDGYSESYIDLHPNDVGEYHYDYRRVMNGIAVEVGDKILCTTYPDDLLDEKELSIEEQVDIINTWDKMNVYLKYGLEDPTSKWGAELCK